MVARIGRSRIIRISVVEDYWARSHSSHAFLAKIPFERNGMASRTAIGRILHAARITYTIFDTYARRLTDRALSELSRQRTKSWRS